MRQPRQPVAATALIHIGRWFWNRTTVTPQGCMFRLGRLAVSWARQGMHPQASFAQQEAAR